MKYLPLILLLSSCATTPCKNIEVLFCDEFETECLVELDTTCNPHKLIPIRDIK